MPETASSFSQGMPVEIGRIDRELKNLWEFEHGAATRASLMNLAVYCEGTAAMNETTALISELTRDHACRAILIATEPGAPETRAQAWISAHCHLGRAGAPQVCCEQITFLLEGDSCGLIPNIVFSHLDSDLPLYLWWRGELSETLDEPLLSRVDRLIFDSQSWADKKGQFQILSRVTGAAPSRLTLCDLNWTRSLCLRQALAQVFDHPGHRANLRKIDRVTIVHSPRNLCTAILTSGWLAAQLGWKFEQADGSGGFVFRSASGPVALQCIPLETPGIPVSECMLTAGNASFRVAREPGSDYLHAYVCTGAQCDLHHLLPAGKDDAMHLLNEELALGGKHQVYLRALAAAEALW